MPIRRFAPRGLIARRLALVLAATLAAATPRPVRAQQPAAAPPADSAQQSPLGTWRGTSTCTPGHPTCHDETVVYRIRAADERFVELTASKIVGGEEEHMFTEICDHAVDTHVLTCSASYGTWSFTISGRAMTGTLVVRAEVWRRISVSRSAN